MTQKEALDILKTGRNVFLTGAAGSGKTHVIREYINFLKGLGANIGITASTGIAATHMGGITIHSWSGIGIRDSLKKEEITEIAEKQHVKRKVRDAKVLLIDEISMLHHFRLDMVDVVLREIKGVSEPFGGMQVVLVGDFFQLPPVFRRGERGGRFAYHSNAWKDLSPKVCYLSEQHRQNDAQFINILNSIRLSKSPDEILKSLQVRLGVKPRDIHTRLYSLNKDVDFENEIELQKIKGPATEFQMMSRGRKSLVEALKKSCLAPENLRLKGGAKVMFVKNNFEEGYVNGTMGTVVECRSKSIKVRTTSGETIDVETASWAIEENGRVLAEIIQYPLRLAWAITIHKSQGMSLDSALIDLSNSFEKGMGYVALSRVRSLEGLFLKDINPKALEVDPDVQTVDVKFREDSSANSFHVRNMSKEKLRRLHSEFENNVRVEKKDRKLSTVEETKLMLDSGASVKDIAKARRLKPGTIIEHIEEIKREEPGYNIRNLHRTIPEAKFRQIYSAFRKTGISPGGEYRLSPVKELLGSKYSYDDLRLVRLFL
jgi:ATP-dependent exoDNAse (exonuclease V) alpha subunit